MLQWDEEIGGEVIVGHHGPAGSYPILHLSRDLDVLKEAREDAFGLLAADPGLQGASLPVRT